MQRPDHNFSGRIPAGLTAAIAVLLTAILISFPVLADVGQQTIDLPSVTDIDCASYFVYDRTKAKEVIGNNADGKIYPASMTKIMTASLALDDLDTAAILTVSQAAIDATTPNSTKMGLLVGEQVSVSELLYGLMLPSGNDAANVLAEAVVDAVGYSDPSNPTRSKLDLFSDLMNKKAAELGLTGTHFVNANGLQNDNHYTTAHDLAMIFDYALKHDDFRAVISSPTHVFKATNLHTFDAWSVVKNTNCLLTDPWMLGADTKVAEVVGGKTGTTIDAGTGMTILTVNQNGDELISVVCGIPYEKANRLTSDIASVVNAGAAQCFSEDPVIRVNGNVMDNKPFNAPAGLGPSGTSGNITPTATSTPTEAPLTSAPSEGTEPTTIPSSPSPSSGTGLMGFVKAHLVISILVGVILLVVLALVVLYFLANRSRRKFKNNSGIRRI